MDVPQTLEKILDKVSKMEICLAEQRIYGKDADKRLNEIEPNVKKLEDNQNKVIGAAFLLSIIFSTIGAFLIKHFTK